MVADKWPSMRFLKKNKGGYGDYLLCFLYLLPVNSNKTFDNKSFQ